MSYTVAKNTSFLTAASIGQKLISFVYFTIIARLIGVENTGQYFFALTFTNIFAVVADFGYAAVLTREMSKDDEKTQSIFSTAFSGKLLFGGLAYLLVVVFVNLLGYSDAIRHLIYLAGLTMWLDNFHSLFYAVFRAKRNLKFESFGIVGSQLLTLAVGTTALVLKWPLIWLIAAYTIPSFCNVLYSGYFALRRFGLSIRLTLSRLAWSQFFSMVWPFALAGIVGRLYAYSDSLIMSKMLTAKELGWWSVPYKIVFAFQFIPLALSASVYPVFSSLFVSDRKALANLFEKSWQYLFIIVLPLAAGIMAIADKFIIGVYGPSYANSILPLRILVVALVFGYLGLISGAFLNATLQQKKQTMIITLALVLNIFLNLLLIPEFGIIAAAISALCGNMLLWLLGLYFVQKQAQINLGALFGGFMRALIPAVIMGIAVYALCLKINFIVASLIGAVIYFSLLFATGGISMTFIREMRDKLRPNKTYENTDNNA
jgi:O-antigen/teichoic acid export membrane protein